MSYLAKVLHDGSGKCFPDIVRLERHIFYSPTLWGHQDDLEVVTERIIPGEISEGHSPTIRPETSEVRESGTVHHVAEPHLETKKINQKLLPGVQGGGFLEKSPPGRRRQREANSKETVMQKQEPPGQPQIQPQPRPQPQRTGIAEPQEGNIQSIPGTAKQEPLHEPGILVKTVEVSVPGKKTISESAKKSQTAAAGDAQQKQKSPELLQAQLKPQPQKTVIAEPKEENIQSIPGNARQEPLHEPGIVVKTVEVTIPGKETILIKNHNAPVQKKGRGRMTSYKQNTKYKLQNTNTGKQNSTGKKSTNDTVVQKQESPEQLQPQPLSQIQKNGRVEPQKENIQMQPTSSPGPDVHVSGPSSKKREKSIDMIVNEISSIKKKLDEHIRSEHSEPEPQKPVFLPQRPASRNLGGWSDLERNALFRRC